MAKNENIKTNNYWYVNTTQKTNDLPSLWGTYYVTYDFQIITGIW